MSRPEILSQAEKVRLFAEAGLCPGDIRKAIRWVGLPLLGGQNDLVNKHLHTLSQKGVQAPEATDFGLALKTWLAWYKNPPNNDEDMSRRLKYALDLDDIKVIANAMGRVANSRTWLQYATHDLRPITENALAIIGTGEQHLRNVLEEIKNGTVQAPSSKSMLITALATRIANALQQRLSYRMPT